MIKKCILLSLLFVCSAMYCMEGDVKPFSLEEMQKFNTHQWGERVEQEVREAKENDSFKALFADPVCQRVLISEEKVGNEFCDRFYSWFRSDTLQLSCERPYGDFWPAVKRMIMLSALVDFGTNNERFKDVAKENKKLKIARALEVSVFHDDVSLAHFLLERGADPNDGNGYHPNFIHARSVAMATVLLQYGANYQHEKVRDWTLLHAACGAQHASDLIPFYLGKGCPVNGVQESTTYPPLVALARTARFHEPEKVKAKFEAFLQAGVDIYNKGFDGHHTALGVLREVREGRKPNQASVKLGIKILEEAQEKLCEKK